MKRLQACKFELRPNGQQVRQMRRFAGACRFVSNKALALQKARPENGEKKLGYAGLGKLLTQWRHSKETDWLAEASAHPLQRALKDLERASSNFFRPPTSRLRGAVGIDRGVVRFATLSDGTFVAPLNSLKRHGERLRKAQQALSRKVRGSRNWERAQHQVQRIYARIATARRNLLHKVSTALSGAYGSMGMEELKVQNLTRLASGTVEAAGRKVGAKSGLNKSILDQGWYELRRQQACCGGEPPDLGPVPLSKLRV